MVWRLHTQGRREKTPRIRAVIGMHARSSTTARSRRGTGAAKTGRTRGLAIAAGLGLGLALACSSPPQGVLVVGIQSEPLGNTVRTVRITASTTRGVEKQTIDASRLPYETTLTGRGTLDLEVEGLDPNGAPVLVRTARAPFPTASAEKMLVRIRLTSSCLAVPINGPGGADGNLCAAASRLTCIGGRCVDDRLAEADLELYTAGWAAADTPDLCRPANAGPPEVIVGSGQTDYLPLAPNQVVQLERGPQGGHHLYVALRMKNLHRSGSTTTITGKQPGSNVDIPPAAFIFTFDPAEGGYCKLYGLRYQLDAGGADYTQFLDKDFDLTVTVRDTNGTVGSGTVRVHIAPTLL
jgi:hypothetical protein